MRARGVTPSHARCHGRGIACSTRRLQHRPSQAVSCQPTNREIVVDVAVVGSGVVGLGICHELLRSDPKLRVAVIERRVPCSGATGAGQGYLWMAHRTPATPAWHLAARSLELWRGLLPEGTNGKTGGGVLLRADTEYQEIGSLLVATTPEEAADLEARTAALQANGIAATYHDQPALQQLEPALSVPADGGGLLVPTDCQLNGRRTAEALLEACQALGSAGATASAADRFTALMHESVVGLSPSGTGTPASGGHVLETEHRRVRAERAVVLAAGAWSGELLSSWLQQPVWAEAFRPRRGHLLELARPEAMPVLRHGVMEMSYTKHYTHAAQPGQQQQQQPSGGEGVDITFTATTSASGTLLIGSSREFSGWDNEASSSIVAAILERAGQFLAHLPASSTQFAAPARVGLRPFAVGGLPWIGPVPELPGVYLAAGHEGSGLTLGPATAELIASYLKLGSAANVGANTPAAAGGSEGQEAGQWARAFLPAVRLAALSS